MAPSTGSGQSDDVLFEKRADGVGLITLNRPDSLNAMGGQLMPMLSGYLAQCAREPDVRCVVLTGNGRGFCAGGDVKEMGRRAPEHRQDPAPSTGSGQAPPADAGQDGQRPSVLSMLDPGVAVLRESQMQTSYMLHTMPKPTIAMVNGYAVGAGFSLALACDLRVASEQARFGTAFRNIALSGDFGGSYFLQRLVGMGKARELYFTAEIIDAQEALRVGMVNRVVPHERLAEETLALAAKLAAGPTSTFARMKDNLNLGEHSDLRTLLDQEGFNQRLTGLSNDSREAVRAFIEKREPKFAGS
jgi:2-(1,2-epoxy-1,2-dihydrophenyl)acetyl-CoA isomerase